MTKWLHYKCEFCNSSVEKPAGLLATPILWSKNEYLKQHLCLDCSLKVNKVLDLTTLWNWKAGFYWSNPIRPGFWNIGIKNLTKAELEKLKSAIQK